MKLTQCLAVVAFITVNIMNAVSSEEDLHFNCGRFGQSCAHNGVCVEETGKCVCAGGYKGYNCRVGSNKQVSTNTCDRKCHNGGTCYSDKNAPTPHFCFCPPGYTGDLCQNSRVSVKCSGLNLAITFIPMDGFNGTVYLGSNNSDTSCRITRSGSRFVGEFSKNKSVCDGLYDVNMAGDETFTKQMTIQYNPDFLDDSDLVLNLSCSHSANHTVQSSGRIHMAASDKDSEGGVMERYRPAKLEIRSYPDLTNLTSDVHLGQRVYMFNFLEEATVFKTLRVEHCVVADPDIQKSVTIIENSCPTQKARKLFEYAAATVDSDQPGVKHDLKIFKLRESTTTLIFTCTVTMCKSVNESKCDLVNCGGNFRGRRSAGKTNQEDNTKKQETMATIRIASDDNVHIITSEGQATTCANDPMVQTTLVTLGVVSILLLLVCIVLVYFLCRYRTASKESEPVGRRFKLSQ